MAVVALAGMGAGTGGYRALPVDLGRVAVITCAISLEVAVPSCGDIRQRGLRGARLRIQLPLVHRIGGLGTGVPRW